jgi:predicted ATP-grasp superfamily ATP-dependent carboligase
MFLSATPHKENSYHKRCRCRKWIYLDGGERIGAKTRSWEEAEARLRELEAGATKSEALQEETRKTILEAVDFYLRKAKDEGNTADTLNKKTRIFRGLLGGSPGACKTLAEKIESTKKGKGKFSPSLSSGW